MNTLKEENIDPILLILSSDHYIEKIEEFRKSIQKSIELASYGNLIIFGIIPSYPATGYGYIKSQNELQNLSLIPNKVEKFIEKPNLKLLNYFPKIKNIVGIAECSFLKQFYFE